MKCENCEEEFPEGIGWVVLHCDKIRFVFCTTICFNEWIKSQRFEILHCTTQTSGKIKEG